ncbi:DUF4493 domain-containing protein [Phocaeicola coprophilus]|uniref:DUF4493 domain-containing protein n=1 Tax=Phocaeicola coprophilus TaxID=387090 RepID=UPI003AEFA96F
MKKYIYLLCSLLMLFSACQQEQNFSNENIGYLRLDLGVNTSAISRSEEVPYDPKQLAVQIITEDGEIVKQTNDWTEWEGQQIALPVGTYTLKASSAGFDGMTSGFDKPYYTGSEEINIEKDKEVNKTVTCTLANVKVTVIFDQSFVDAFKEAKVTVDDNADNEGIDALDFVMGQKNKSAYFPVTDLKAIVNVVNQQDIRHSQTDVIQNVQPRDHYILTYKVGEITGGDVSISIDETTRTYTYNFTISTLPKTTLTASANAWSKFAYLEGTAVTTETLESTKMVMQYRLKNAEEWTPLVTAFEGETYKAKVEGLTPATEYECRMVYGEEEYVSAVTEFTTETTPALPNGNFDNWWRQEEKDNSPWYAIASGDATAFDTNRMLFSFWDSGNGGTAPLMRKNPTAPEETEIHTTGGKGVKMQSQFVGFLSLGKFAAGNIYTGHFCSANTSTYQAKINFGQPFVSRPTQMKGWFKYNRGTDVNYPKGEGEYKTLLQQAGGDLCGIYIALVDNEGFDYEGHKYAYEVNGDLGGDDPTNFKYKNAIDFSVNNSNIIAYGSITDEEAKGTGEWQEFTIDLKYRDLTRKPKYIIVVASASKYGDYFTGSTGSLMYIDDFELVYDGEPSLQE